MKTDSQVQQDVMAELRFEPAVDPSRIGVEVKDGVTTLTGHVGSFSEKCAAERAAQRVLGVRALAVEMDVALPGPSERDDADIARSAELALRWTHGLDKEPVKVMVENGWVTLSGQVEWDYLRRIATGAVRHLVGVRGVSDSITLRTHTMPVVVKSTIEAALKRRWDGDADDVSVNVIGSTVTLTGTVHTWWDRQIAQQSAWAAPGVHSVVDNLTVRY
jgi:osmotically-inducible protein OsmY